MELKAGDRVNYRRMVRARRQCGLDDLYTTDTGVILSFSETNKTARVQFSNGKRSGMKWIPLGRLTREEK